MDHIIEPIIELQGQVAILPEENMIQPSRLVSHLEKHAEFERLGPYQLSQARYEFEDMKARTSGQFDDTLLYYVAVYSPAYVDTYRQYSKTSLIFVPFAIWRNKDTVIGYGNLGYERPWMAYMWTTYIEKHNFTSYESLQSASDSIKKDGLVAEGKADSYYELYTFPASYEVKMSKIVDKQKEFQDPVWDLETRRKAFKWIAEYNLSGFNG